MPILGWQFIVNLSGLIIQIGKSMGLADKLRALFQADRLDVNKRFEILREAVSGTMSKFYKVRDRQTKEILGLKICDTEKTSFFEGRFQGLEKPSEGEVAIQFHHPRIVRTFEYGTTTDSEHYLLMEYLEGPGLNACIHQQSSILEGRRVTLIRQMAEALAVVHDAEFIHRDICPRNFICAADANSLKLIDFGLTVPAKKEFMQPGNRSGTPNYMAPEIIRRKATDKRVDIFSLGVTAYQLCANELPWPTQDVTGKAAVAHDTQAPVDIFSVCPNLNRKLGEIIMQCLERSPDDRPQTAESIRHLLSKISSETK